MQSKTSFFNTAVLRKDITRFAPIWGGYTLCAVLVLLFSATGRTDYDREFWSVEFYVDLIQILSIVNCGYALVVAQALFGDLYSSRACYALHAMPLRRETWYLTHVVSGLLFAIVPNLLLTVAAIPTVLGSCVVKAWMVPVYAALAADLQYIFFFGVAVLCSFCAGNRLGMAAFYGIVNFGAMVAGLLIEAIYVDLLFGVTIASVRYTPFSPMWHMSSLSLLEFEDFYNLKYIWEKGDMSQPLQVQFSLVGENWGYYATCAAIGLALLAVGIWLYRERHLECAGDFLAFRALEPVFMAAFTIGVGAGFQLFYTAATYRPNDSGYYLFLAVGLIIGWFVGKMLLARSTRVFTKKNLPGLVCIMAAMALSLGLTWLDPLNIEGWMPELEDVASVTFSEYYRGQEMDAADPTEIREMMTLHKLALDQHLELRDSGSYQELKEGADPETATEDDYRYAPTVYLVYTLKNGRTVIRHYHVWLDSEAGQLAKKLYSDPQLVLEQRNSRFKIEEAAELYVNNIPFTEYDSPEELKSLWAALYADCESGNMANDSYFHTGYFQFNDRNGLPIRYTGGQTSLDLSLSSANATLWVQIYPDAENTINWLTQRGILEELGITVVKDGRKPAVG